MANLIEYKKFSSINIVDPFFDSLKGKPPIQRKVG